MTSDATESAKTPMRVRWNRAWRGLVLPGWLFAPLAILLLALLVLLGLLFVVSTTYVNSGPDSPARLLDRGWALLASLAMLWALVNLHWSTKAAGLKNWLAVYGHFAIVISCGLIVLGIDSIVLARAIGSQPIVMDYSQSQAGRGSRQEVVAVVQGDAEEGRKIFSTTCITCHGPTGGGMPNLAPSLRASPFIASADDAAVASVIRLGRTPADPNNKTKKVMPARGGNPFLGDDKIVHLVAFVRAIQNEGPGETTAEQDPNAPPPVQLAKWVLPTAPTPPMGMISLKSRHDIGDAENIVSRSQRRRSRLVETVVLGMIGIHSLFLIGVMTASSNLLARDLTSESPSLTNDSSDDVNSLWTWSSLGWIVAAMVWLLMFLIGFVMT